MAHIFKKLSTLDASFLFIIQLSLILPNIGCKKLIEVNTPTTSISAKNVYTNDVTAISVLTGIYSILSSSGIPGSDLSSIGFMTGLSGDELTLYGGSGDIRLKAYYQNNLKQITSDIDFWTTIYNKIYILNHSIEGLNASTSLTPIIKQQLLGEAKFARALYYFYLVNLYGDVPLAISTDYTINNVLSRSPEKDVWVQIISDLKEAQSQLSMDYLDGNLLNKTRERIRPTKWAATALLARSYLYIQDWKNAEIQASEIINNTSLYSLVNLNEVFLMNSLETIWQLQPVNRNSNTEDAKVYIISSDGPSSITPVLASPQLLNSFEIDDQRKQLWIDTVTASGILYHYIYKYKYATITDPLAEYNTVLRLGEQYLIRAEAEAQQNNLKDACDDLNKIRSRAMLKELTISEKSTLLSIIYHERQVELFTEWGHRWLDLKRTQRINSVMNNVTPLKGGTWNTNWKLYPIPSYDILSDGNLIQNTGY